VWCNWLKRKAGQVGETRRNRLQKAQTILNSMKTKIKSNSHFDVKTSAQSFV